MCCCSSSGVSAYFIPCFFFGYAVFLTLGSEAVHPHLKKVGGIVLFVSMSAFFGLQGETIRLFGENVPSGGMLGGSISYLLLSGFSATGAYIITLTAIVDRPHAADALLAAQGLCLAARGCTAALIEQLELMITVYQGRKEKAREAKQRSGAAEGTAEDRRYAEAACTARARGSGDRKEAGRKAGPGDLRVHGASKDGKGAYQLPITGPARPASACR